MRCFEDPGAMKIFRRKGWRFEQTFETPLKELEGFAGEIVSAMGHVKPARVMIEQVVFEPKNLMALSGELDLAAGCTLEATGRGEVEALLRAALGDWVDFAFVPAPSSFVIYADHDEYTTVLSMRKLGLMRVVEHLAAKGFKRVEDYRRGFGG